MSTRWYKLSDTELLAWLLNFSGRLSASASEFHITTQQAEAMAELVSSYDSALSTWREPSTGSSVASQRKQAARIAVVEGARNLVASIKTNPLTTDEQRTALGIALRAPATRIPVPREKVAIQIGKVSGRVVNARVYDPTSGRRRPDKCCGACVWTFVGENPGGMESWTFWRMTTRPQFKIEFAASVEPGSKIWLAAAWANARGELGPICAPVGTYLQFGPVTTVSLGAKNAA